MSYHKHHPSTRIKGTYSNILEGKRIALGITGSVASFLSPQIARELIRHGAEIIPMFSKDGERFVGKDLLWWATGTEPITEVTGDLEHISLAGVMNDPVDLMLIAPTTTNTVAKLAAGVADTPVTLIASSLNGKGIPIMTLCVAHIDLINSPPVQEALTKLRSWGINTLDPVIEEGKAKVPEIEDIIFEVMETVSEKTLSGTTVLVTGGPTREYIDNVRYITNGSSGRMGIEIAKRAQLAGATTQLLLGHTKLQPPRRIKTAHVLTTQEMVDEMLAMLDKTPNATVILSSAMADFTPAEVTSGKIKSGKTLSIELKPTTKLSDLIKIKYPQSKLVLFKAEWDVSKEKLAESAKQKLEKCNADLIIANDLARPDAGFDAISNHVILMDKTGDYHEIKDSKSDIAKIIIDELHNL